MEPSGTVFIVDDEPEVRRSLSRLVESIGLRAEAFGTATEFLERYAVDEGGCLVADMRMPGLSGLDLQEKLVEQGALLPVIILTGHGEVPSAVRAMKLGAFDFIEKPFSTQLLLDRIQQAIEADEEARRVAAERSELAQRLARLTRREREVMERMVTGRSNRQIAEELGLSQKTVEFHRANVMQKLGADSLAETVRIAMIVSESGKPAG